MDHFTKCIECKPPKRHPGCQDTCPYYAEGVAALKEEKAAKKKFEDSYFVRKYHRRSYR